MKKFLSAFLAADAALLWLCAPAAFSAPKIERVPELAGKSLVFVERKQFPQDHHNTANIFQFGEINEGAWNACAGNSTMYIVDFDGEGNPAAPKVLAHSKDGIVRDPEVSYDAKKIVFSMRGNRKDSYSIYETDLNSGKAVRLTRVAEACDIDPAYLGDGSIVFASTRAAKYCGCNRHIMCNLYKMDSDGSNIVQIGNSIEFEHMPHVLRDGRILYTRWEYVDRNFSGGIRSLFQRHGAATKNKSSRMGLGQCVGTRIHRRVLGAPRHHTHHGQQRRTMVGPTAHGTGRRPLHNGRICR